MSNDFNFTPTGIGSLPHKDPLKACELILKNLPQIPFWPQLPQRDFNEGMATQFAEGVPGLLTDRANQKIYFDTTTDFQKDLEKFYENYLNKNLEYFAISNDHASGLHAMVRLLTKKLNNGTTKPQFIKGQITGPITWGISVTDETEKAIIHNEIMADVVIKNLVMKALWQINLFRQALNLRSIIFVDEPSLMGYGSAYSPINREMVEKYLGEIVDSIHEAKALTGIHCCGNTDWGLLLSLPFDIINFDAYDFLDKFLLYQNDLKKFIDRGGVIAWGIVPVTLEDDKVAAAYKQPSFPQDLIKRINTAIDTLVKKGFDKNKLFGQSLITTACGMGMRREAEATALLSLLQTTASGMKKNI